MYTYTYLYLPLPLPTSDAEKRDSIPACAPLRSAAKRAPLHQSSLPALSIAVDTPTHCTARCRTARPRPVLTSLSKKFIYPTVPKNVQPLTIT